MKHPETYEFPRKAARPRSGEDLWLTTTREATPELDSRNRHIFEEAMSHREGNYGYDSLCGRVPGLAGKSLTTAKAFEILLSRYLTGVKPCRGCLKEVKLEHYAPMEDIDAFVKNGGFPGEGERPRIVVSDDEIEIPFTAASSVNITLPEGARTEALLERLRDS